MDGSGNETESNSFNNILEVIILAKTRFYQPVNTMDLLRAYVSTGSVNGMLSESLGDPYTRYMEQHAYESMMDDTSGVFGGIGISIGIRDNQLTIVSPIRGTPGERAGLRAHDKIVKIDDRATDHMTTDEAANLMRGQEGTEVTLTIERGEETLVIPIIRAMINVNSVERVEMLDGEIGYIQLTNFSGRTFNELVEALALLDADGMGGLILDLRFNPGGTFVSALQVADEFISSGALVHLEDRNANRGTYEATFEGTRDPLPMAVLINGSSASASEIVAGALRDHELAVLVGSTTFGKGLVQSVIPLREGGALSLTEQVYLTAGGHDINQEGIEPDYVIELEYDEEEAIYLGEIDDHEDRQLMKAMEIVRDLL